MNIFILDLDTQLCAQYHADKHVVKMILETCQLLCTTMRIHGIDYGYKATHKNHPCRKWLDESQSNFNWLKNLGLDLCKEYSYRYTKTHKSQPIIENTYCPKTIPNIALTSFAQAMPNEYKDKNPVKAYREYYRKAKYNILSYTGRPWPSWIKGY